jgi:FtsP/CotA-like multicopper oxidase with cupredoxin domain
MVVAAAAFPSYAQADSNTGSQQTTNVLSPKDSGSITGFRQPCVAQNGTDLSPTPLKVSIEKIAITLKDEQGQPYQVSNPRRVYNGQLPGPTFKLKPGEKMRLTLINDLPPNPSPTEEGGVKQQPNVPEQYNTTNLHFHGFHVSPLSLDQDGNIVPFGQAHGQDQEDKAVLSSDDVLYKLRPRQKDGDPATTHEYSVWLPADHPPGTHWYHSHYHGSTAIQVVDGMVGALIVEEPDDQKIPVDQDLLWIVHEVIKSGTEANETWDTQVYKCNPPTASDAKPGSPSTFLVNGEHQPTLTMSPGELHRWRFLNATGTPQGFMTLKFQKKGTSEPVKVVLMAVDGISFYEKQLKPDKSEWPMAPGNRADFLVKLEEAGEYQVFLDTFEGVPASKVKQVLAYVIVTGPTQSPQLQIPSTVPGTLPAHLRTVSNDEITDPVTKEKRTKTLEFLTIGKGGCGDKPPNTPIPLQFAMNQDGYNPDIIHQAVTIGTAEEWTISNQTFAAHPFHIHVNPFQVVDDNGNPTEGFWRDTIAVPPTTDGTTPGQVKIRHRFLNYPGTFVLHCHILIHEDLGMMQNVMVAGTGLGPGCPLPAGATVKSCEVSVEKPLGQSNSVPATKTLGSGGEKTPGSGGGKIPGSGGGKGSGGGRIPGSGGGKGSGGGNRQLI